MGVEKFKTSAYSSNALSIFVRVAIFVDELRFTFFYHAPKLIEILYYTGFLTFWIIGGYS